MQKNNFTRTLEGWKIFYVRYEKKKKIINLHARKSWRRGEEDKEIVEIPRGVRKGGLRDRWKNDDARTGEDDGGGGGGGGGGGAGGGCSRWTTRNGGGVGAPLTPALAGGEGRQRLYAAAIRPVGAFARTLHPKRTYREESVVLSSYRRIHAVVVVVAVVEPSSRSRRESKSKSKTNSRGTRKREREIEVRSWGEKRKRKEIVVASWLVIHPSRDSLDPDSAVKKLRKKKSADLFFFLRG